MCVVQVPSAVADFEFVKPFGPDGAASTGFTTAGSVAVDPVEEVSYVLDRQADAVYKFDLEGNPVNFGGSSPNISGNKLSGLSVGGSYPGSRQVAVNPASHTIYLTGGENDIEEATALQAFQSDGEPALFSAGPGAGTNEIMGLANIRGVALDSSGNIYVSGTQPSLVSSNEVSVYSSTGAVVLPTLGVFIQWPHNLAVDTNGVVYVLRNRSEAARFVPSEFPVTPSTTYTEAPELVDPNPARSIAVEPALNRVLVLEDFEDEGNPIARVAVFDEFGFPETSFGGPGESGELDRPDGLGVGLDTDEIAKAFVSHSPEGGLSQVEIFEEEIVIDKPTIEAVAVSNVTADGATLRAKVNPNNLESTYWFEYGTADCEVSVCTKVPVDSELIGDGRKGVSVSQVVTGLKPQTTYHYRVVAENSEGPSSGSKTFTTQGSGLGFELSDGRAWEMVSPPRKFGGFIVRTDTTAMQASVSGVGLVYSSRGPIVEKPASSQIPAAATLLAKRGSDGRWLSEDLTPPHSNATEVRPETEFKIFSPNLLEAQMEPADGTPLSPEATEQTPYLWTDGDPPLFTPMLTPANVPSGTKFGPVPGSGNFNPVRIEGATPDLSRIVLSSQNVPLTEGAVPSGIYMWADGGLQAISEMPDSEGGALVTGMLGSGRGSVRHAISNDGARVFWTSSDDGYNAAGISLSDLYLRDMIAGESVRLDVPEPDASGLGDERPAFNVASADGRIVFFTDSQQLTKDASPAGRDLYRCEVGPVGSGLGCIDLTNISAPLGGAESAEVLDQVSGLSEDGTRLYFVARGVLTEAPNEAGDSAISGEPNLYYWQEGEGTQLIATLSERDYAVWGGQATLKLGFTVTLSATASPNGRFFAFTSEQSLTGYENRNSNDQLNTEVYLFDAEAGADPLACVSCDPSGAAAVGEQVAGGFLFPADPGELWNGRWVAANLATPTQTQDLGRSLYQPRSVLENGRVFFNSVDPLVPADSNGNWDVYQYEPVGVGSCTAGTSAASTVRSGRGCVGLISSGTSEGDSGFLDATPSGDDIFFLTRGRLSVLDRDDEVDVYDARVNGIPAALEPIQECSGEACRPSTVPLNDPTPFSESFHGVEKAPLRCRKGQRKVRRNGRLVCVRKAHKKQGKQNKKRAGKDGRAQR